MPALMETRAPPPPGSPSGPMIPGTGEEIEKREVVKGYEYSRGQFLTFTAEPQASGAPSLLLPCRFGALHGEPAHRMQGYDHSNRRARRPRPIWSKTRWHAQAQFRVGKGRKSHSLDERDGGRSPIYSLHLRAESASLATTQSRRAPHLPNPTIRY